MSPPTPLKSKKCSLCGKRRPLSAYLTTEKNGKQLHGSVCHKCLGIDGRFLSLHILRKKIQQLLGKFGSGGLFNKNDEDEDGGKGDGSWDPEDRGKSKEYRLNLDAEELGAEAKQHGKLVGEKKEAETKAQKKEHKQTKIEKEKIQKKQTDALDEKTEKEKEEKEEKKLEQEAKDEKTADREKKQDKKKLANTNKERLFSSYLQKNSNAQRSYGQNKTSNEANKQTPKTSDSKDTSQASKTQENKTTTATTTNTQQQTSSSTAQTSSQQSASSTQATNTTTSQQNQHGKQQQQQQNATAFYKQNPNVADQFADLSNVTIRNTVPTSVSAGTVRLFQQANMDKGKAGTAAHQEARQEGKQATAKGEADQLKKAMQISMKSWK
jgi:hypothetical protein